MNRHTCLKIAVSIPAKTLRAVELERKRLGRSRSSVTAEALDAWLCARSAGDRDRRYLEGYARHPEPEEAPVAVAVMAAWDAWEEPRPSRRSSRRRGVG